MCVNAQSDREKRISNGGAPGSAADSSRGGELGRGEQERRSSRGSARGLPTRGKEGEGASGRRVSRRPRGRARPPTGRFREGSPKVPSSSLEHALPALRSKGQPRRPLANSRLPLADSDENCSCLSSPSEIEKPEGGQAGGSRGRARPVPLSAPSRSHRGDISRRHLSPTSLADVSLADVSQASLGHGLTKQDEDRGREQRLHNID